MSIKKASIAALLAAAGMAVSSVSMAQSMQDRGWYVGGSLGQAEAGNWCDPAAGATITSCDDKDTGWKVFGGYRLSRHFAAEASYINFGEYTATVTVAGTPATVSADATGWGLAALGIFPLSDRFELFGKLGFVRGESEADVTIAGTQVTVGDKGTELHYGLGATYNLTRNFGVRAEWENVNDAELSLLSIGIQYRF
jgi:OOP family OmpA-OmpF porin